MLGLLILINILIGISYGKTLTCVYNSREYQAFLNPEVFSGQKQFSDGVESVLELLTSIEKSGTLDFRVSRSSLEYSNISTVRYSFINPADVQYPIKLKSRRKKVDKTGDFVLKISSPDPVLTCVPLNVAEKYMKDTESKFEIDYHAINGRIMAKTAMSYSVDNPNLIGFNQLTAVIVSDVFTNADKKLSSSGKSLVAIPTSNGVQLTANFNIRLNNEQYKATVLLLEIGGTTKCEFSFRIKGEDVSEKVLFAAQDLIAQVSLMNSLVARTESIAGCDD